MESAPECPRNLIGHVNDLQKILPLTASQLRLMLCPARSHTIQAVRHLNVNKKDANSVIGVFQEVLIKLYYIPILLYIEGQDDIY